MTTLELIPAVDIRRGRCVRLMRGDPNAETVYYDDPVKMACLWRVQNAKVLHLVDLDAAKNEGDTNRSIVRAICEKVDIPVQVGGGIRSMSDIEEALDTGAYRVVLGTAAAQHPDLVSEAIAAFGPGRIVVGIDASEGEVRVDGWTKSSGLDAVDMALDMEKRGCTRFVYTDIARDGTLEGPNIDMYRQLGKRLATARITASGGISGYQSLMDVASLSDIGVDSVIVGRALYENRFPCQKFWCWHEKDTVNLDVFSSASLDDGD